MRSATAVALGVLAAVAIGTYGLYRQDLDTARERVARGSRIAQTRCGPIEYAEVGKGPAVLVVHGSGGGIDQGLDFGGGLAQAGLRVVAMSRFGYLRTPLPVDASAEAQADAHACLLDALGIGSAFVVGASAGAPSSMQLALRHPDRVTGLVLLVPAAYAPRPKGSGVTTPGGVELAFQTALRVDFLYWAALRLAPGFLIGSILATPPELVAGAAPGERERVRRMLEHILPVTARRDGFINDAKVVGSLGRYTLEKIGVPTLLVSYADDRYGTLENARYSAAAIPLARLLEFQDGGHVGVGHEADVLAQVAALAHTVAPRTRAASSSRIAGPLLDEDQPAPETRAKNGLASPRRRLP